MFVVIWSGWGILVVPLAGAGLAVGIALGQLFGGSLLAEDIGMVTGCLVATALIRVVGQRLNRWDDHHRFFNVPMQHWAWGGVIFALAGVAIMMFR
ncbi:hypothetical protein [Streptomyces gobitricini]|uniref:Integral membrane protein n=1 Tax=Streptomyces gobitricini TaxID=68211 RepID=A0ABN3M760_9ACTN